MSEKELSEFKALESRLRSNINSTLYKIALGALGVIIAFAVFAFMGFANHGERISTVEEVSTTNKKAVNGILNETGVEFVARRVAEEGAKTLRSEFKIGLDEKADKSAFIEFDKKLDMIIQLTKNNKGSK